MKSIQPPRTHTSPPVMHTNMGRVGKSKEMSKIRVDFAGMSLSLPCL